MLIILAFHFSGQSGALDTSFSINWCWSFFLHTGGRLAVNCFVMIGAWFLVVSEFKAKRIVRIWFSVFSYTLGITLICLVTKATPVKLGDLKVAFFPISYQALWFASCYIGLLFISPFLNMFLIKIGNYAKKLLIVLFILLSVLPTFLPGSAAFISNFSWFVFLYLLIGYVRIYGFKVPKNKNYLLLLSIALYFFIFMMGVICKACEAKWPSYSVIFEYMMVYYKSHFEAVPGFLCAFTAFLYIKDVSIPTNKVINFFGKTSFGIYIIHQTPILIPILWAKILKVNLFIDTNRWIPYSIAAILGLYVSCAFIEWVKQNTIDKIVLNSRIVVSICSKIDSFFKLENS